MKLFEPILRKRADKSFPQTNKVLGDISKRFISYNNSCVHFGEVDNNYYIIKLLVSDTPISESVDYKQVVDSLFELYPKNDFINEFVYFSQFNMHYQILIIFDEVDWKKENNKMLVIDFTYVENRKMAFIDSIKVWEQKDYQIDLVRRFGINRTNKPLIYSTTEFEGYLSDVSTPYCKRNDITLFPGDVDLITFSNDFTTLNIFEFKKHTKFGYGSLEYQSFLKYFNKDYKKYKGLANLALNLNKSYFYNIIYSTRENEDNLLKIEKIGIDLKLIESHFIEFENLIDLEKKLSFIIQ